MKMEASEELRRVHAALLISQRWWVLHDLPAGRQSSQLAIAVHLARTYTMNAFYFLTIARICTWRAII